MFRIKIYKMKYLLECILGLELFVLFFYILFVKEMDTIWYSIIHAALAGISSYEIILILKENTQIYLGFITLYVINVYFCLSCIKYAAEYLYIGFITDNNLRMLGSFLVFLTIMGIALKGKKKWINTEWKLKYTYNNTTLFADFWSIFLFVVTLYFYVINTQILYRAEISGNGIIHIFYLFYEIISGIAIFFVSMRVERKNVKTFFPAVLIIMSWLIRTAVSGSRMFALLPLLVFAFMLYFRKQIPFSVMKGFTMYYPFFILAFSVIVLVVSGREERSTEMIIRQMTYRFDLSDFPMTLMRDMMFKVSFAEIRDGIFAAVPSMFLPKGAKSNLTAYADTLAAANLQYYYTSYRSTVVKDYTDTYFSMGVASFGIIGMMGLPAVFIWLFDKIDSFLRKKDIVGLFIEVLIMSYACSIEKTWASTFASFRNMMLCYLAGWFISRIFSRRKTLRYSKNR